MSDWTWCIDYRDDDTRIILSSRGTTGTICEMAGDALRGAAWPWRLGIGRITHRAAESLIEAAERRTRVLAEVHADAALLAALQQRGAIDPDTTPDAPTEAQP